MIGTSGFRLRPGCDRIQHLVRFGRFRPEIPNRRGQKVDPFGERASVKAPEAARRLVELVRPHAEALGCAPEVKGVERILTEGTSTDRQLAIYRAAIDRGLSRPNALSEVKAWLQAETEMAG